jgi:uncharacterized protein
MEKEAPPMTTTTHPLEGWDIGHADRAEWVPWGSTGNARAKVLATGDGYHVVLVEADAGYESEPHVHEHTEFSYVLEGEVRTQGTTMHAGDAYAAAVGSEHTDFGAPTGARYLSIFRL